MGYVYEKISEADAEAYGLEAISNEVIVGRLMVEDWVVDRERNSYLRKISEGRPDVDDGVERWTFYWNGTLTWITQHFISTTAMPDGSWLAKWCIDMMAPIDQDPTAQSLLLAAHLDAARAWGQGRGGPFKAVREFEFAPGVLSAQV